MELSAGVSSVKQVTLTMLVQKADLIEIDVILTYGEDPATTNWYGVKGEREIDDSSWLNRTSGAGQEPARHEWGTRRSC